MSGEEGEKGEESEEVKEPCSLRIIIWKKRRNHSKRCQIGTSNHRKVPLRKE